MTDKNESKCPKCGKNTISFVNCVPHCTNCGWVFVKVKGCEDCPDDTCNDPKVQRCTMDTPPAVDGVDKSGRYTIGNVLMDFKFGVLDIQMAEYVIEDLIIAREAQSRAEGVKEFAEKVIKLLQHESIGMEMYIRNDDTYSKGAKGGFDLSIEIIRKLAEAK